MLNCPRNAMIDAMLLELNLGTYEVKETNIIAALRHIRSGEANNWRAMCTSASDMTGPSRSKAMDGIKTDL